jgi:hypothetical protein
VDYLDFDELYDYNYPTLVDMNGFEDSCDEVIEELLRIVFYGRLPEEGKLMDAVKLARYLYTFFHVLLEDVSLMETSLLPVKGCKISDRCSALNYDL